MPVFAVGFVGQRFAQGQCGALGQAVGHEDLVALVIRAAEGGGICLAGDDEVHRHGVGALVQLLEEGVLGVGARDAQMTGLLGRPRWLPLMRADLPLLSMMSCCR